MAEVIHFYSYQTNVSLALPVGWEEQEEAKHSVMYYYEIFDEEDAENQAKNPQILIKLFAAGSTDPQCLQQAAKAVLSEKENALKEDALKDNAFSHLSHSDTQIDSYPALTDVFSYYDETLNSQLIQNQTFALVDDVLFSFTGITPEAYKEDFLAMYETALKSVRFIFVS